VEKLDRIIRAMRNGQGEWRMVTLTIRHRKGMPLAWLLKGLAAAWRRCRQGGKIQKAWSENVTASIRATEVTTGRNGWHPHLHVVIRSAEWTPELQAELTRRWKAAVIQHLGAACVPDDDHGIDWGPGMQGDDPKAARYLMKLGMEVAGTGKGGTRCHWSVAERAVAGDAAAVVAWREYATATKGRRMSELDDRAAAMADQSEPMADLPEATELDVNLDALEVAALRKYELRDPGIMGRVLLDVATSSDPAATVGAWVRSAMASVAVATGPPVRCWAPLPRPHNRAA
jgi:hypothetical protein